MRQHEADLSAPRYSGSAKLLAGFAIYYGLVQREVIFTVAADSLEEAWNLFLSSSKRETPIFSVIKTETEIYLAQGT